MLGLAGTLNQRLAVKKWLILAGVAAVLTATAVLVVFSGRDPLQSRARRNWARKSIAEIAARVAEPAWPTNEFSRLKPQRTGESSEEASWISDHIILTRKGEWLAYASVCRKEDGRIHDIFLARGSDGRWYYSTYHFCVRMIGLRIDDQPEDLAGFARTYYLRTFDGRPDDCLKKTWPPNRR
jgi:hypothetical protein